MNKTTNKRYTLSLGFPGMPFTKYHGTFETVLDAEIRRDELVKAGNEDWKNSIVVGK